MPEIRADDIQKAQDWLISQLLTQVLALKAQEFAREREARDDTSVRS